MSMQSDYLAPIGVLAAICMVVSGALAGTYQLTKPVIDKNEKAAADAGRLEVLSEGADFKVVEGEFPEGTLSVYEAGNGAGYVVQSYAAGYGGPYEIMIGVNSEGTLSGLKVMKQTETPGIGSKTMAPEYLSTFVSKDKNLEGVEAISGATISSTALRAAVDIGFQAYEQVAGDGNTGSAGGETTAESNPQIQIFPGLTAKDFTPIDGDVEAYKAGDKGVIIVSEGEVNNESFDVMVGFNTDGTINGAVLVGSDNVKISTDGVLMVLGEIVPTEVMIEVTNKAIEKAVEIFPTLKF